jgi:hypothetical protein
MLLLMPLPMVKMPAVGFRFRNLVPEKDPGLNRSIPE